MALASAALAQGNLAEQALNQSGAVEAVPTVALPAPPIADTVPVPVVDSVPKPAPVIPQVPKPKVAPAVKSSAGSDARHGRRIAVLAGATNWHWEEADDAGDVLLVEGGIIPMARFEFSLLNGDAEMGGAFDISFGAIDYDGAIQNSETGELVEYKSKTHYSNTTFEAFAFLSNLLGPVPVEVGGRVGYHRWVRTIGGDEYEKPDEEAGYVETWTHMTIQPVVIVKQTFGANNHIRIEGGIRVPISTEEKISDLPGGGGITIKLKPKTENAYRVQGQLKLSHLLVEVEYLALDFGKSDLDSKYHAAYQPDSYLDRLDARVGWEF